MCASHNHPLPHLLLGEALHEVVGRLHDGGHVEEVESLRPLRVRVLPDGHGLLAHGRGEGGQVAKVHALGVLYARRGTVANNCR